MNNYADNSLERVWEQGWQDHSSRQLERLARLPLAEKLLWLEEAHRLILHMQSTQMRLEAETEIPFHST